MTKHINTSVPVLIGLTGGIGAGKSAVANILKGYRFPVIDADRLAKNIVKLGSPTLKKIKKVFGKEVFLASGKLNRPLLRKKIAQNKTLKKKLEAITHPEIRKLGQKLIKKYQKQGHKIIFYEAPLLIEANRHKEMDAVVCVIAPNRVRLARIQKRDRISLHEAKKIMHAQMPQTKKAKYADYIIKNDGNNEHLRKRVLLFLEKMLS